MSHVHFHYTSLYMVGLKCQCSATARMPMQPQDGSQASGHTLPSNNCAGPDIALLTTQGANILGLLYNTYNTKGPKGPQDAPRDHEKEPQDLVRESTLEQNVPPDL